MDWKRQSLVVGTILLVTVVAYIPAMRGGFIWDDDDYVTNNETLRSFGGLGRIWIDREVLPQWYPLVHTTFWIEYHLWGLQPFGYHLVNVLLHAVNAVLLYLILRRLEMPGAWLAAMIFALHPVCVESVAWITERKNVLSGLFYFSALLAYMRFCPLEKENSAQTRNWRYYPWVLTFFVCALFSKTVTATLPAAILLLIWLRRGSISWQDIVVLLPMFALSIAAGRNTALLEIHRVGAKGPEWDLSIIERGLIAGRVVWFYAGKLIWPAKLAFIYPRWQIDAGIWWQYLYPGAAGAVLASLWLLRRRIGRGALVAVLFFSGTLFPALGFFNVYPMQYSFVADHFQYLASAGLITLFAVLLTKMAARFGAWAKYAQAGGTAGILIVLGVLTWQQGYIYEDLERLWRDTVRKNRTGWMPHINLAFVLADKGEFDEALFHHERVLQLKPNFARGYYQWGFTLARAGKLEEAAVYLQKAIELKPRYRQFYLTYSIVLFRLGKTDLAEKYCAELLEVEPDYPEAQNHMGVILAGQNKVNMAMVHLRRAIELKEDFAAAHFNLADSLFKQGKSREALKHYLRGLRIEPDHSRFQADAGTILAMQGESRKAVTHYRWALQLNRNEIGALNGLAWILATNHDRELHNAGEAVSLAGRACELTKYEAPDVLDTLAAAEAAAGDFAQAVTTAESAQELALAQGQKELAEGIRQRLELYRAGSPYRDPAD